MWKKLSLNHRFEGNIAFITIFKTTEKWQILNCYYKTQLCQKPSHFWAHVSLVLEVIIEPLIYRVYIIFSWRKEFKQNEKNISWLCRLKCRYANIYMKE